MFILGRKFSSTITGGRGVWNFFSVGNADDV